ncbi:hypothetical protein EYF80_045079 [Liparis tanakae]|uniref:Uncharacterized protein n=1 Tax=Liparis tanakae TaxID=230148 RepID=A0A4Z2FTV2_9TELE|nr:hypothetical protein EYF80_045079 [Liparis tanakae]
MEEICRRRSRELTGELPPSLQRSIRPQEGMLTLRDELHSRRVSLHKQPPLRKKCLPAPPPLTSVWLRPAGAQSYSVVLKVGSLRVTTGLVTIMRFLLYTRRPPPPLTFAVKWEQGESASRRPIRWSSSASLPAAWSTAPQPQDTQAFLHRQSSGGVYLQGCGWKPEQRSSQPWHAAAPPALGFTDI